MPTMSTRDGRWHITVGGLGSSVVWYRLVGPGVDRWLPSTKALLAALTEQGMDPADLLED